MLADALGEKIRGFIHIEPKIPAEVLLQIRQEELNRFTDKQCELVKIEKKTAQDLQELAPLNDLYLDLLRRPIMQERKLVIFGFIQCPYFQKDVRRKW